VSSRHEPEPMRRRRPDASARTCSTGSIPRHPSRRPRERGRSPSASWFLERAGEATAGRGSLDPRGAE
jgi:hypothetical protein